ncbi:MAG TPA: hypothetical protein VG122_22105 [Gemmata sp.]|nr:hypothetical protein [Gemmata sp.]
MLSTLVLALLSFQPEPMPLDNIGTQRARTLVGKHVLVSLLVGKPPYTWRGVTVVGADDRPDGVERTAVLIGKRFDLKGKRIIVAGTLRVIEHPGVWIGAEIVLPWTEIRVEETR